LRILPGCTQTPEMNRIRAYFDRIQGRLLAALAPGALAMLVLFVVSTVTSERFSAAVTGDLGDLQTRIGMASRLEGTISDQVNAALQYLISRDPASLDESLQLAQDAQALQSQLMAADNVSHEALQ
jgi:glycerate-2-kinase